MTKTPGLDQSQAHARAARTLSEVLAHQRELSYAVAQTGTDDKIGLVQDVKNAAVAVKAAREALRKAYLEYTNPFGVEKTV